MSRHLWCLFFALGGCGVDQGVCPQYLACVEATATPSATLRATYGEDGVCWSDGNGDAAMLCRAQCEDNLAGMALVWPEVPECAPPEDPTPPPARIDLLLVLDTGRSIAAESGALALALDALFEALPGSDVQAGIVSADVRTGGGRLIGGLSRDVDAMRAAMLCEATCFADSNAVPSDPGYQCGEAPTSLSREYLDCTCGAGQWDGNCAGSDEEGIEAALLAVCRAADNPPDLCFETVLSRGDTGTNPGLLREDATLVVLALSDDGDTSRRVATGASDVTEYVKSFQGFGRPVSWNVFGPDPDRCATTVTSWSIARYQGMAEATGGVYAPLAAGEGCTPIDFRAALRRVAGAL